MHRSWIAGVAAVFLAGQACAMPAIDLDPLGFAPTIQQTETYTGSCGGGLVRIASIEPPRTDLNFFVTTPDTHMVVMPGPLRDGGPPHRELSLEKYLSDYVGVACVRSPHGARLLVWTVCGGTICGSHWGFFIVDPNALTVFPKFGSTVTCDAKCAAKIIGSDLPIELDKQSQ